MINEVIQTPSKSLGLNSSEKLTLIILLTTATFDGTIVSSVSQPALAEMVGISRSSIIRVLSSLEDKGFITSGGFGRSGKYYKINGSKLAHLAGILTIH